MNTIDYEINDRDDYPVSRVSSQFELDRKEAKLKMEKFLSSEENFIFGKDHPDDIENPFLDLMDPVLLSELRAETIADDDMFDAETIMRELDFESQGSSFGQKLIEKEL